MFVGIQRRRCYLVDEKVAGLEEAAQPAMTISHVTYRYSTSPSPLFGWRQRLVPRARGFPSRARAMARKCHDSVVGVRDVVIFGAKNEMLCAAGVAQLVEHQFPKLKVAGSKPVARSIPDDEPDSWRVTGLALLAVEPESAPR